MQNNPPSEDGAPVEAVRALLAAPSGDGPVAILTTAAPDGWPHTAWMGTVASPDRRHLYALTSPDSAKVRNITHDPRSEWMLVDAARETVVYVRGHSRILTEITELKRVWHLFPDKSRSYFLAFFNSAPGYAVIETAVESIEWLLPRHGKRGHIDPGTLL